jgi:hypothetical protein
MGTDNTITTEMWEQFLANGKGALAGSYLPVPDTEETSALATIQNGFADAHMQAGGLTGLSIKDGSINPTKIGNLKLYAFAGMNGSVTPGACTLTGAKVGDVVLNLVNLTTPANIEASFESKITVNDQIQQVAQSNLSAVRYLVLLITPPAYANLKVLAFTGHNLAGACTLTGAQVGDTVIGVINLTTPATAAALFEGAITVINQIQQVSATDLSAVKFLALLT